MQNRDKTYSIKLTVHPAVAKWIDSNFPNIDNVYELRDTSHYIIFQSALFRKNIKPPSKPLKKTENYVPIRIFINEWDFYHFGWDIPNFAQIKISKLLFDLMMLRFCELIADAYAFGKIPRDVTIRRILVENLFEDDQMNYFYIRKYYQRKFQDTKKEQQIIDFANYTIENVTQI